ncbi:MAG: 4Fe-4S binding protein [Syntrophobacteraceae bacterium]|nr:4Fe-4S binding protein [Syntrophobacteraceae bacterium]
MIWTREAEEAVLKAPFFVRRRVRLEVEKEAARQGSGKVLLRHVSDCKQGFLSGKAVQSKGFQIESCFGESGCKNRANGSEELARGLEKLLIGRDIAGFLKEKTNGELKIHHEFRICFSDCPNACSHPQIADIGIIGAVRPRVVDARCTGCSLCFSACNEGAILAVPGSPAPAIDAGRCVQCGKCIDSCPAGAIEEAQRGWRILAGGKLGRHPQLGIELEGIYSEEDAREIVRRCLDIYFAHNTGGERLGAILNRIGIDRVKMRKE